MDGNLIPTVIYDPKLELQKQLQETEQARTRELLAQALKLAQASSKISLLLTKQLKSK